MKYSIVKLFLCTPGRHVERGDLNCGTRRGEWVASYLRDRDRKVCVNSGLNGHQNRFWKTKISCMFRESKQNSLCRLGYPALHNTRTAVQINLK
jgi:hypothetical protein